MPGFHQAKIAKEYWVARTTICRIQKNEKFLPSLKVEHSKDHKNYSAVSQFTEFRAKRAVIHVNDPLFLKTLYANWKPKWHIHEKE